MALMAGMNNAAVYRLKLTREEVPRTLQTVILYDYYDYDYDDHYDDSYDYSLIPLLLFSLSYADLGKLDELSEQQQRVQNL